MMEQRLHIVIILPNADRTEATAFNAILEALKTLFFPGQGYSLLKQVEGWWRNPNETEWIRDYSTWYITDMPVPKGPEAGEATRLFLSSIRDMALAEYKALDRPQNEIWIITHTVERHGRS